jgi:hypothetical protein
MIPNRKILGLAAFLATASLPVQAQTQFLPIPDEPAPQLHVEQPVPGPLASRATVIIPYRTENFRILPVFGAGAADVSPRAGHLHVTVDDLPWHWADAGNTGAIVLAGLPAGQHKVLIEIATPDHRVISGKSVSFTVPALAAAHH